MRKIKDFWESLDGAAAVSKRELFLGMLSCVLAGIVFGVFFGPKKTSIIGSHNGCGNSSCCNCEDEQEQSE